MALPGHPAEPRRNAKQPGIEPFPLAAPSAIDDTLQLILLCESHVALILKTVSGSRVAEIARAFLLPVESITQRLVSAKRILREQGVTSSADCLTAVHTALYLLFNAGYPAGGKHCGEAIRLVECLRESGRGTPETQTLRALFYLYAVRFSTPVVPHRLRHSRRIDEPCSPKPFDQPAPTALPLRRAWACWRSVWPRGQNVGT